MGRSCLGRERLLGEEYGSAGMRCACVCMCLSEVIGV